MAHLHGAHVCDTSSEDTNTHRTRLITFVHLHTAALQVAEPGPGKLLVPHGVPHDHGLAERPAAAHAQDNWHGGHTDRGVYVDLLHVCCRREQAQGCCCARCRISIIAPAA